MIIPENFTVKLDTKTATQAGIGFGLMSGILMAAGLVVGMYVISLLFDKK